MIYSVEPMRREDIPQVIAIEKESFPTLWPPNTFQRELGNHRARYLIALELARPGEDLPPLEPEPVRVPSSSTWERLVAKVKGWLAAEETSPLLTNRRVVGYLGMWLLMDEAHITAIAVRASHRRRGIGERLLIAAIELATELAGGVVTLEVRVSNLGAQLLYEKYGFHKVGIRRSYYSDNKEDALIMSTDPVSSDSFQERFQRLKQLHAQRWEEAVGVASGEQDEVARA